MTVTLTQSTAARFPDRGNVGLLAQVSPGGGGAHLQHVFAGELVAWHTRWLFRPVSVAGGPVVLLAGFDEAGVETFRAMFDPALFRVSVTFATGASLVADLPAPLPWHAVEIGCDTVAGSATLHVNGVPRDQAAGAFTSLATKTFWFGVVTAHADAAGEIYLDEWALSDTFIGPVRVEPKSPFADDPARWLVVYNTAMPDSVGWVEHYRAARGVPFANLLGLDLPTSETINASQFAALNDMVESHLVQTGLADQVMGILVGFGVPGYVDFLSSSVHHAVDDLLHHAGDDIGVSFNPNAADALPTRPTQALLGPHRLTARIDAPDLAGAVALVDRATAIIDTAAGDGSGATLFLDPFVTPGPVFSPVMQRMLDWAQSIDRQRLRIPVELSGPLDSTTAQAFTQLHHDGFFWGWNQAQPPAGFFVDPPGRRVVCAQLTAGHPAGVTARGADSNWITAPLAAGYAAAVCASKPVSTSAIPLARPFFESLRRGWTLAEAVYLGKPILREGFQLIGDPLLRVRLPRSGWDVFGPLDALENMDPSSPLAALASDQHELTLPVMSGHYVVRSVDTDGQAEHGVTSVSIVKIDSLAVSAPVTPIWPRHEDWPMRRRNGSLELTIAWDRSMSSAGVVALELQIDSEGDDAASFAAPWLPSRRYATFSVASPLTPTRYRWRVTHRGGAMWASPWSVTVPPPAPSAAPVHVLEVRP